MWGASQLLDDFLQFNGERDISFLLLAFETDFRSEWVEILSHLRENGFVIGVLFCLMRLF